MMLANAVSAAFAMLITTLRNVSLLFHNLTIPATSNPTAVIMMPIGLAF